MFFCDEILSFLYLVLLSRKHKPSKDKNFRVNLHNYESWSVEVFFIILGLFYVCYQIHQDAAKVSALAALVLFIMRP